MVTLYTPNEELVTRSTKDRTRIHKKKKRKTQGLKTEDDNGMGGGNHPIDRGVNGVCDKKLELKHGGYRMTKGGGGATEFPHFLHLSISLSRSQ